MFISHKFIIGAKVSLLIIYTNKSKKYSYSKANKTRQTAVGWAWAWLDEKKKPTLYSEVNLIEVSILEVDCERPGCVPLMKTWLRCVYEVVGGRSTKTEQPRIAYFV